MDSGTLFSIIIGIIVVNFVIDKILDALNAKHFNDPLPPEIADVYEEEEYQRPQRYKQEKYRFGVLTSSVTLIITLLFFFFDGFAVVDELARSISDNAIIIALIFSGIIMLASDLLSIPFGYYNTFVIEEKYGFNKYSKYTFFMDKLKGLLMLVVLGGSVLALVVWFYQTTGKHFWLYAWGIVTLVTLIMNLFYSIFIVPLLTNRVRWKMTVCVPKSKALPIALALL